MKKTLKIALTLVLAATIPLFALRPADACPGAKQGEANKMKAKGKNTVAKGKPRQVRPDKDRKI